MPLSEIFQFKFFKRIKLYTYPLVKFFNFLYTIKYRLIINIVKYSLVINILS